MPAAAAADAGSRIEQRRASARTAPARAGTPPRPGIAAAAPEPSTSSMIFVSRKSSRTVESDTMRHRAERGEGSPAIRPEVGEQPPERASSRRRRSRRRASGSERLEDRVGGALAAARRAELPCDAREAAPSSSRAGRATSRSALPSLSSRPARHRSWRSSGTTSSPATMLTSEIHGTRTGALPIAKLAGGRPVDHDHRRPAEGGLEGRRPGGDEGEVGRGEERVVVPGSTTRIPVSRRSGEQSLREARRADDDDLEVQPAREGRGGRPPSAPSGGGASADAAAGQEDQPPALLRGRSGGSDARPSRTSSTSGWPAQTASAPRRR